MSSTFHLPLSEDAQPPLSWDTSGERVQVHLGYQASRSLRAQCERRRGVDRGAVGGLLVGRAARSAGEIILMIEECRPLHEVLQSRELFVTPGEQEERLQRLTEAYLLSAGGSSGLLGIYHSAAGEDAVRSQEVDLRWLERFGAPGPALLVAIENMREQPKLRIQLWRNQSLDADTRLAALDDAPTPVPALAPRETAAPAEATGAALASPPAEVALPFAPSVAGPAPFRWALVLTGAILLPAAAYWVKTKSDFSLFRQSSSTPAAVRTSPLGLNVEWRGSDLQISWDPQSPKLRSTPEAMLVIRDGPLNQEIPLSGSQVQAGRLLYRAATNRLEVALQVTANGRPVHESISVVTAISPALGGPAPSRGTAMPSGRSPDASSALTFPPDSSASPARPSPLKSKTAANPASPREEREVRTVTVAPAADADKPAAPVAANRPAEAAHTAGGPVAATPKTVPEPAATQQSPSATAPPAAAPVAAPASPRPLPSVESTAPASSNGQAASGPVTPPSAPQETPRPITFVAARPLSQVQPAVPPELRPLLVKDMEVEIRVSIGVDGKVTAAAPVTRQSGLAEHLSRSAVYAATQWRFSPAKRDGQTVPSDAVLRFRFGRN